MLCIFGNKKGTLIVRQRHEICQNCKEKDKNKLKSSWLNTKIE